MVGGLWFRWVEIMLYCIFKNCGYGMFGMSGFCFYFVVQFVIDMDCCVYVWYFSIKCRY